MQASTKTLFPPERWTPHRGLGVEDPAEATTLPIRRQKEESSEAAKTIQPTELHTPT